MIQYPKSASACKIKKEMGSQVKHRRRILAQKCCRVARIEEGRRTVGGGKERREGKKVAYFDLGFK